MNSRAVRKWGRKYRATPEGRAQHKLHSAMANIARARAIPLRAFHKTGMTLGEVLTTRNAFWRMLDKRAALGRSALSARPYVCPEWWDRMQEAAREVELAAELTGVPMELDHVIPISRGGSHDPANIMPLTKKLNREKGAKLPGIEWNYPKNSFESVSVVRRRIAPGVWVSPVEVDPDYNESWATEPTDKETNTS